MTRPLRNVVMFTSVFAIAMTSTGQDAPPACCKLAHELTDGFKNSAQSGECAAGDIFDCEDAAVPATSTTGGKQPGTNRVAECNAYIGVPATSIVRSSCSVPPGGLGWRKLRGGAGGEFCCWILDSHAVEVVKRDYTVVACNGVDCPP